MGNTVIIEVTGYIEKPAEMGATNPRVDKDTGSINIAEREQARTMLKEIAMICTPVLTTCMHEVWGRRGGH
jgi:hypothetical protein